MNSSSGFLLWSGREDSNLRPHPPQRCTLPLRHVPRKASPLSTQLYYRQALEAQSFNKQSLHSAEVELQTVLLQA